MGRLDFKDHGQNRPLGLQPTPGNYEDGLALPTQGGHPALGLKFSVRRRESQHLGAATPGPAYAGREVGLAGGLEVAPRWILTGSQPGA